MMKRERFTSTDFTEEVKNISLAAEKLLVFAWYCTTNYCLEELYSLNKSARETSRGGVMPATLIRGFQHLQDSILEELSFHQLPRTLELLHRKGHSMADRLSNSLGTAGLGVIPELR